MLRLSKHCHAEPVEALLLTTLRQAQGDISTVMLSLSSAVVLSLSKHRC